MDNKIKYVHAGKDFEFNIGKFKAIESLDFILDIINYLPENIELPDESKTIMPKNLIKYIIFMVLEVGDLVEISSDQKELLTNIKDFNLIKIIFTEAYLNSDDITRNIIRNKLFSLLQIENGTVIGDIDNYIRKPKDLFNTLVKIMEYNYNDFFLI